VKVRGTMGARLDTAARDLTHATLRAAVGPKRSAIKLIMMSAYSKSAEMGLMGLEIGTGGTRDSEVTVVPTATSPVSLEL
jgi:hypothetical protein